MMTIQTVTESCLKHLDSLTSTKEAKTLGEQAPKFVADLGYGLLLPADTDAKRREMETLIAALRQTLAAQPDLSRRIIQQAMHRILSVNLWTAHCEVLSSISRVPHAGQAAESLRPDAARAVPSRSALERVLKARIEAELLLTGIFSLLGMQSGDTLSDSNFQRLDEKTELIRQDLECFDEELAAHALTYMTFDSPVHVLRLQYLNCAFWMLSEKEWQRSAALLSEEKAWTTRLAQSPVRRFLISEKTPTTGALASYKLPVWNKTDAENVVDIDSIVRTQQHDARLRRYDDERQQLESMRDRHQKSGDLDAAMDIHEQVMETMESRAALAFYAGSECAETLPERATHYYQSAIEHGLKAMSLRFAFGTSLKKNGDWWRLEQCLARFEKLLGDVRAYYTQSAAMVVRQGQIEKAVALFEKAVHIDLKDSDSWLNLGVAYLQLGVPRKARHVLDRAAALTANIIVLNDLGVVRAALGDLEAAKECWKKYAHRRLQGNFDLLEPTYNLGVLAYLNRDLSEAIQHWQWVVTEDETYVEAWYCLGVASQDLGNRARAAECFKRAGVSADESRTAPSPRKPRE